MKLNHLILVICTGILVGFSACKKDPFTEADAIAAQKELITMKYGYELQLKNIDAAIAKAHDDAQIAITNLNIKGTSDLEKQKALQVIADYLAKLAADRDDYLRMQRIYDSIDAADAAAEAAAAFKDAATVYNTVVKVKSAGKVVVGARFRVATWDGTTYYTATSNQDGIIQIKNLVTFDEMKFYISGPASSNLIWSTISDEMDDLSDEEYLMSFDPTTANSISGTVYAAIDLTNNSNDVAGAAIPVTVETSYGNDGERAEDSTVTLTFNGVTDVDGTYSVMVPANDDDDNSLEPYVVSIPEFLTVTQTQYELGAGDNEYQVLPTKSDDNIVKLQTGTPTSWDKGSAYFLTLRDSDDPKGYSVTLTDPLNILAYALDGVDPGGDRTPDGESLPDSSLSSFSFNVDGFVLNNGWLTFKPSEDPNVYYTLPISRTYQDSAYEKTGTDYINPYADGYLSGYGAIFSLAEWLDLTLEERIDVLTVRFTTGIGLISNYTPTALTVNKYGRDTLAVEMVDLTGFLAEEAPELSAIVYATGATGIGGDSSSKKGFLQKIKLLEDANGGLFNIDAVLGDEGIDRNWFTNYEETPSTASANTKQKNIKLETGDDATDKDFFYGKRNSGDKIRTRTTPLGYYPLFTPSYWD